MFSEDEFFEYMWADVATVITYWVDRERTELGPSGLVVVPEDDTEEYTLSPSDFKKKVQELAQAGYGFNSYAKKFYDDVREGNYGAADYDATIVDDAVQQALFDDVRYG